MGARAPQAQASDVSAEEGEVMIDGPDGLAISMTPEAATETARRLNQYARIAADQRRAAGGDPPVRTSAVTPAS